MKRWLLSGAAILNPNEVAEKVNILIEDGVISLVSKKDLHSNISYTTRGIVSAGLINSHDHLLGTYYPKVGNGPYENWLPWDNDLKSSPIYQERQQIENRDLYLLGAYRNLVSGVTTVSDHMPHFVAEPFYDLLPVKAIREYSLAHSVNSFALSWGDDIEREYKKAVEEDIPFITHIAEGFDSETQRDVETLDRKGGLGEHSVLIHGIAFTERDMDLIKKKGATVVWCGDSNMFMFNKTTNIKMLLDKKINVCIGTDSPMSGGLNLLEEMKFDKKLYKKLYGEELPDETIYRMVTVNPAKGFRLYDAGTIKEGNVADLVVVRDRGGSYVNSVVSAGLKDIMLVVINGMPAYGDVEFAEVFDALGIKYQEIVLDGVEKVVIGDLKGLLRRISKAVGFKKEFPFLPVEF
ncbi:MAG TPA: amidohydrolase family protein [Spirochaetota bacterium]|jgi:cytosine/adenosine deaminase-related metal-dependent hydrolase|nr:amidohydrolase family protein [Spirochaetota bacterium]OQA97697.1 MAG: 5-methylthioadenosine/S-adenosylhomocysteine deaminase [Spirochaetes bacterium ADurb.Bin218]HOK02804.1 amidohydrolase family protein [Spirochaetota bacterium]HOK92993.1 amidohydrolase family protein [Spirochaetota bacterium]HON15120.1 amidohydrolase family protein [Spirochaetota bacterium]